jgi:hypothetical protein
MVRRELKDGMEIEFDDGKGPLGDTDEDEDKIQLGSFQ